jgi:FkbH-like protein
MNITEALKIVHSAREDAARFEVLLACGFTPLHMKTFLGAHLQLALPGRKTNVTTGLYGSVQTTLEDAASGQWDGIAVALEWADLDPRLGFRTCIRWETNTVSDILAVVRSRLQHLRGSLENLACGSRVALSLPTLTLPPIFRTTRWQVSEEEALLHQMVAEFQTALLRAGVVVVNTIRGSAAPLPSVYDFRSDLLAGLPYALRHADSLASTLARLLCPVTPKKGLITDLDDTLWRGVVGEDGPQGVSWDLASHSALHGLYQTLLSSLAQEGVLLGVATKNEAVVVEEAFKRSDILLERDKVFPLEAHWQPKSGSVERILRAWNLGAESVVFVDDSPLELAEVSAAHPEIECIPFPSQNDSAGLTMLRQIRDLFGKERVSKEDSLRLDSIRQVASFRETEGNEDRETLLQQVNARVSVDFQGSSADVRSFDLVNKSNQFNLNGIRYTQAEWLRCLSSPNTTLIAVHYEDKFGPLGKIAAVVACQQSARVQVKAWVMSCRAFARRIEYQCLRMCFDYYQAREIEFAFTRTTRNGPMHELLVSVLGHEPQEDSVLTRERFEEICPPLYHTVETRSERQLAWTK